MESTCYFLCQVGKYVINMSERRKLLLSTYSVPGFSKYFIMYSLHYVMYVKYPARQHRVAVNTWARESDPLD